MLFFFANNPFDEFFFYLTELESGTREATRLW